VKDVSHRGALAIAFGALVLLTALAVGAVALQSGAARPHAQPPGLAFRDAPLTPGLRKQIAEAAQAAGVRVETLREVAGAGTPPYRASIFVGSAGTSDLIALRLGNGSSTFTAAESVVATERPLSVSVAAQPDAVGETGHVQLAGIAMPEAKGVFVELASGVQREVALVRVARGGIWFLAYASDDPATFPVAIRAVGANGKELASHDLRSAVAPPQIPIVED
jgi:hypothetical protein